jgi:hypothetical protein
LDGGQTVGLILSLAAGLVLGPAALLSFHLEALGLEVILGGEKAVESRLAC